MLEPLAPHSCAAASCSAHAWACRTSSVSSLTWSPETAAACARPAISRLFGCFHREPCVRGRLAGALGRLGSANLRQLALNLVRVHVLRRALLFERDLGRHLAIGTRAAQPSAQRLQRLP